MQSAIAERRTGTPFNGLWVVSAPWAHLAWEDYALLLLDLTTEVPGVPAPIIYLEGATHELQVYALQQGKPIPLLTSDTNTWKLSLLRPMNHGFQFCASSDCLATIRIQDIAEMIEERSLSPDTDFRRDWDDLFQDGFPLRQKAS